ncbi:hypothetical protein HDU81_008171 [Chytriomyces hyalinus]|nr:hypothetical protein HDU81_008171 [Chytriomyces hyalinus]
MNPATFRSRRQSGATSRSDEIFRKQERLLKHKARKGDAFIPSAMELFFLELDAEFKAKDDRERVRPLQERAFQLMKLELQKERERRSQTEKDRVIQDTSSTSLVSSVPGSSLSTTGNDRIAKVPGEPRTAFPTSRASDAFAHTTTDISARWDE